MAQRDPVVIAKAKISINVMRELSLEDGLKMEQNCFAKLFSTQDYIIGLDVFIEKKKPVFSGK